jgi:hypothetical protein
MSGLPIKFKPFSSQCPGNINSFIYLTISTSLADYAVNSRNVRNVASIDRAIGE